VGASSVSGAATPSDSDLTQIRDHAAQAGALLPKAIDRTNWTRLLEGLFGLQGAWADDDAVYVIQAASTSPAMPPFACSTTQLATLFGAAGAATITAARETLQAAPSTTLGDVALYLYDGAAVALESSADDVRALLVSQDLYELPESLSDAQILACVKAGLGTAPRGGQEIEGEFWKCHLLRRLANAYGDQLDKLGGLVGITRDGMTDAVYREAIGLKAAVNASAGTIEQILTAASGLAGVTLAQLLEIFPLTLTLYVHGTQLEAIHRRLLCQMPREGIGMNVVAVGGTPFVCGPDGGWHAVQSISGATVTALGDATARFSAGDRVRVVGVASGTVELDGATVVSSSLASGNTDVVLDKTYAGTAVGAANPMILENITTGIGDEDGFGFEEGYAITGVDQASKALTVAGDCTSEWAAGERLRITGSTGNDSAYSVVSATLDGSDTDIVVGEALPDATVDGQLLHCSPTVATHVNSALSGGTNSEHGELADIYDD